MQPKDCPHGCVWDALRGIYAYWEDDNGTGPSEFTECPIHQDAISDGRHLMPQDSDIPTTSD